MGNGDPLKKQNSEERFSLHAREDQKIVIETVFMSLGPQMADISVNNQIPVFNTEP